MVFTSHIFVVAFVHVRSVLYFMLFFSNLWIKLDCLLRLNSLIFVVAFVHEVCSVLQTYVHDYAFTQFIFRFDDWICVQVRQINRFLSDLVVECVHFWLNYVHDKSKYIEFSGGKCKKNVRSVLQPI
jgi:hypothetical protein